jgi:hypothetical protein
LAGEDDCRAQNGFVEIRTVANTIRDGGQNPSQERVERHCIAEDITAYMRPANVFARSSIFKNLPTY